MGTKENVVGYGTIIMDCGSNFLVVVNVPYNSNAQLPIPILDLSGCGLSSFMAKPFDYFEF